MQVSSQLQPLQPLQTPPLLGDKKINNTYQSYPHTLDKIAYITFCSVFIPLGIDIYNFATQEKEARTSYDKIIIPIMFASAGLFVISGIWHRIHGKNDHANNSFLQAFNAAFSGGVLPFFHDLTRRW